VELRRQLQYFDDIICMGDSVLADGVNAFPLVRDSGGGRNGNVEADLLLLIHGPQGYRVLVAEVKHSSNHAWYAAVENARQLKLIRAAGDDCLLFRRRNPKLDLPTGVPVEGAVIAPRDFYCAAGQKAQSVPPARRLVQSLGMNPGFDMRLLVWESARRRLSELA
jgi:hypothetical protein